MSNIKNSRKIRAATFANPPGGSNNAGVVFRVNANRSNCEVLHTFLGVAIVA